MRHHNALWSLTVALGLVALCPLHSSAALPAASQVTATQAKSPWHFDLHGYYRARYVRMGNVPRARLDKEGFLASDAHTGRDDASDAHYAFMRLRLNPTLRWGGDPDKGLLPKVSLNAQIDLLDNVMFGDNARQAAVPLFAENPSQTGVEGGERPSLFVRRLWVDIKLPVGLLKVGRQASQGGLGLLFNDGNGFRNDFGDAQGGSTFDRVAFATRPMTIFNAITRGDRRPTPLILVVGHDWLVEDALGFGSDPKSTSTRRAAGPFGFLTTPTCGKSLAPTGTEPTEKCDDDVSQWLTALIWKDTNLRLNQSSDELVAGLVYVSRGQSFSNSRMHIIDAFWRLRLGLGPTGASLYTAGEVNTIRGTTQGLKVLPGGLFDETTGLAENTLEGGIVNGVAKLGLVSDRWDTIAEFGYSSGDEQLIGGDGVFKMFPMHADYRVGLLMYPVALWARSENTAASLASSALNSGGGVFNSTYINFKGRYRIRRPSYQIELVAQGLVAWADTLNGGKVLGFTADYFAPRDAKDPWANNQCSIFDGACFIGWEADLAVKFHWLNNTQKVGPKYGLRWSNEFGVMGAGQALRARLAEGADLLWTAQSRVAILW